MLRNGAREASLTARTSSGLTLANSESRRCWPGTNVERQVADALAAILESADGLAQGGLDHRQAALGDRRQPPLHEEEAHLVVRQLCP